MVSFSGALDQGPRPLELPIEVPTAVPGAARRPDGHEPPGRSQPRTRIEIDLVDDGDDGDDDVRRPDADAPAGHVIEIDLA